MNPAPSWTVLAHLLRPQGRKGELLADLLTDFPDSIPGREGLRLVKPDYSGPLEEAPPATVLSAWLPVGKNRGRVVLAFDGVTSITEAEALAGLDLAVASEQRVELEEESNYVSDLLDLSVYDGDLLVGTITGVKFPASSDGVRLEEVPSLLEVRSTEGDDLLIPFVKAFVVSIDVPVRKMILKLPAGLLEINR